MNRGLVRFIGGLFLAIGIGVLTVATIEVLQARAHRDSFVPHANGPTLIEGAPIGQVRVDRIGMKALVSQGESEAVLRIGAGHLADTSWAGQPGNIVLAGHRDTVFRPLRKIQKGDVIDLSTDSGVSHYRVVSTAVVPPTDLSVLEPTAGNTLTLVTCYPFTFIGSAPERFVVHAVEVR
jgi:sortase A